MKKILFALFIVSFIGVAYAEESLVIELPKMTKTQIFEKAKQWITLKFVSGRAVMDYADLGMGRIIAKGTLILPQPMGSKVEQDIMVTIDMVNGKTKITIQIGVCRSRGGNGNAWDCNGMTVMSDNLKKLKTIAQDTMIEYQDFMKGAGAPAWDGK